MRRTPPPGRRCSGPATNETSIDDGVQGIGGRDEIRLLAHEGRPQSAQDRAHRRDRRARDEPAGDQRHVPAPARPSATSSARRTPWARASGTSTRGCSGPVDDASQERRDARCANGVGARHAARDRERPGLGADEQDDREAVDADRGACEEGGPQEPEDERRAQDRGVPQPRGQDPSPSGFGSRPSSLDDALERGDHDRDVLVEVDAELLGAAGDVLAVDRRGEARLPELLLHRLGRQAVDALGADVRRTRARSRTARRPRRASSPCPTRARRSM